MANQTLEKKKSVVGLSIIGIVGVVAMFLLSSFLAFWMAISCGGDGGSPYAARDSTYGKLCSAGVIDAWTLILWLLPTVLVAVGFVVALTRREGKPLIAGAGAALAFIVLTIVSLAIVPDECTAEQEANDEGCETY